MPFTSRKGAEPPTTLHFTAARRYHGHYFCNLMEFTPGHTPGSLVVVLSDGRAFVGDMVLGGWLGGALLADRAGEHYFHADLARNHANIAELLQRPIHTFYLGHEGPVTRASVVQAFGLTD